MASQLSPTTAQQIRWGALAALCAVVFYTAAVVVAGPDSPAAGPGIATAGLFGLYAASHNGKRIRRRHIVGAAIFGVAFVVSIVVVLTAIVVALPTAVELVSVHLFAVSAAYSATVTTFDLSAALHTARTRAMGQ